MTALDYLDRIEQTLTIPAAEYVPAIGDVFLIIREARAALSRSPVVGAVGGEPIDLETLRERYEFILSACREAQSLASSRGWALDSILQSSGYQCENYTTGIGSCFTNGRTPEAQYGADRCCHSCIAAKGLSGASPTAAGPMTEERIAQTTKELFGPDEQTAEGAWTAKSLDMVWVKAIATPLVRAVERHHGIGVSPTGSALTEEELADCGLLSELDGQQEDPGK